MVTIGVVQELVYIAETHTCSISEIFGLRDIHSSLRQWKPQNSLEYQFSKVLLPFFPSITSNLQSSSFLASLPCLGIFCM